MTEAQAAANEIGRAYFEAVNRGDRTEAKIARAILGHVQTHVLAEHRLAQVAAKSIGATPYAFGYDRALTDHATECVAYLTDTKGRDDAVMIGSLAIFSDFCGQIGADLAKPGAVAARAIEDEDRVPAYLSSFFATLSHAIALSAIAEGALRDARGLRKPAPAREDAAERMRRIRKKRERGFVMQVPVNLYEVDIEILRGLGFIRGEDAGDKGALGIGVEAFLLTTMLANPVSQEDWGERMKMNAARLDGIAGREIE